MASYFRRIAHGGNGFRRHRIERVVRYALVTNAWSNAKFRRHSLATAINCDLQVSIVTASIDNYRLGNVQAYRGIVESECYSFTLIRTYAYLRVTCTLHPRWSTCSTLTTDRLRHRRYAVAAAPGEVVA